MRQYVSLARLLVRRPAARSRRPNRPLTAPFVAMCLLLAACATTSTGAGSGTPSPTGPHPTITITTSSCPMRQPPPSATPADITIGANGGQASSSITMQVGQTLQIQLSASYKWTAATTGPAGVLTAHPDNGWHDTANGTCVWQFTAAAKGQVTLSFTGRPICAAGVACPQIILLQQYTIAVD
jgi:hypothetical protein